jgi:DNA primase
MADEVVMLYDADPAGEKAMVRAASLFLQETVAVSCLDLPEGSDPDDFLRANGLEGFEKLMRNRKSLIAYVVLKTLAKWDGTSGGKAKVLAELQPLYVSVAQPVLRAECLRLLSEKFSLSEAVLDRQLRGAGASSAGRSGARAAPLSAAPYPRTSSPEETIIGILVKYPSLIEKAKASGALSLIRGAPLRAIAEGLALAPLGADGRLDFPALLELLPDTDTKALCTRFGMEEDSYGSPVSAGLLLEDRLGALLGREERSKPPSLVEALRLAQQDGDAERARRLMEQIRDLHAARKKIRDR